MRRNGGRHQHGPLKEKLRSPFGSSGARRPRWSTPSTFDRSRGMGGRRPRSAPTRSTCTPRTARRARTALRLCKGELGELPRRSFFCDVSVEEVSSGAEDHEPPVGRPVRTHRVARGKRIRPERKPFGLAAPVGAHEDDSAVRHEARHDGDTVPGRGPRSRDVRVSYRGRAGRTRTAVDFFDPDVGVPILYFAQHDPFSVRRDPGEHAESVSRADRPLDLPRTVHEDEVREAAGPGHVHESAISRDAWVTGVLDEAKRLAGRVSDFATSKGTA